MCLSLSYKCWPSFENVNVCSFRIKYSQKIDMTLNNNVLVFKGYAKDYSLFWLQYFDTTISQQCYTLCFCEIGLFSAASRGHVLLGVMHYSFLHWTTLSMALALLSKAVLCVSSPTWIMSSDLYARGSMVWIRKRWLLQHINRFSLICPGLVTCLKCFVLNATICIVV